MAKDWRKIISALRKLLAEVGELWPDSTKLSGYAEKGPYRCGDCEYLKGRVEGNVFRDEDGKGRCNQKVVLADREVLKAQDGLAIVNIERGCCEFVHPPDETTRPRQQFEKLGEVKE